ncbi:capsule assembly Wzi family protein [Psychrosphaera sp. B3R10]|uniref:capsule assembly Wzi family protein n=1 Tax=unclassified Psychrosphaera TaxID=2641570 RepID=UPI001C0A14EC|nr:MULTISPECIES: capsule assembly Wzi family protein [unclassified Psychrosphaera]MBU2881845.1 capsule assembly Wzi family protein [Psychrosphaera sp. I2R16]MBU2989183.1 capsule assembly Wzi family protein [Psychrosphaera sp. B3R10]
MTQLNKDIHALFIVTNTQSMQRPYAVSHVKDVLKHAKNQYPELSARVERALTKLTTRPVGFAQLQLRQAQSAEFDTVIPNQLAELESSNGHAMFTGSYQVSNWMSFTYGGIANNSFEDINFYETYLSFGNDNIQLDVGYKQDWLSPFQTRSMLYSNNAKTTLSVGLKNPIPFKNWWDLQYNVFVKSLERHDNIYSGGKLTSGTPYVLATQLSIQPFKGTTIALNRTFQFGGRGQPISLEQVWGAFSDVVGSDNSGALVTCESGNVIECEFGNQRASLAIEQRFGSINVYGEIAGEDTASHTNFMLGNIAVSGGIHLPFLKYGTMPLSLTYEVTEHQSGWHRHHIYQQGFRVDNVSLGHWGTNYTDGIEDASGLSQTLLIDLLTPEYELGFEYLFHRNKKSPNQTALNYDYVDLHDIQVTISPQSFNQLELMLGIKRDVYNDTSWRTGATWRY